MVSGWFYQICHYLPHFGHGGIPSGYRDRFMEVTLRIAKQRLLHVQAVLYGHVNHHLITIQPFLRESRLSPNWSLLTPSESPNTFKSAPNSMDITKYTHHSLSSSRKDPIHTGSLPYSYFWDDFYRLYWFKPRNLPYSSTSSYIRCPQAT